ncbi:hypothetical protein GCM10027034_25020 [Ramlibacter solisilvae]|uniref:Uncharacterized protein n=2 Tax=Ramlibacter tataouinensis TaxID=94132 RepID=A0A127JQ84_9BURK|nr:hypothetical protein UC35_03935 [Ramlibacter tataouinensis]
MPSIAEHAHDHAFGDWMTQLAAVLQRHGPVQASFGHATFSALAIGGGTTPHAMLASDASVASLPAAMQPELPVQPPMLGSAAWLRPGTTARADADVQPEAALRRSGAGAANASGVKHSPQAAQEPIRVHADWSADGVRIWLGMDAGTQQALPAIRAQLQRWLAAQGFKLFAISCNGRLLERESDVAGLSDADGASMPANEPLPSFFPKEIP